MESCSGDKISCSAVPTALEGKRAHEQGQLCWLAARFGSKLRKSQLFKGGNKHPTLWHTLGKRPANFALTLALKC